MDDVLPAGCTVSVEDAPDPDDVRRVEEGLNAYNDQYAPGFNFRRLAVFLRDQEGALAGGLVSGSYWGWLYISDLWIRETHRGRGWGTRLLRAAEQAALARGCRHVHLDTMSFQALPFYLKQGYTVFGALENMPQGQTRYYLKKDLAEPAAALSELEPTMGP